MQITSKIALRPRVYTTLGFPPPSWSPDLFDQLTTLRISDTCDYSESHLSLSYSYIQLPSRYSESKGVGKGLALLLWVRT